MTDNERDLARHYRTIFQFVRRRSLSHEDAEDVTQTVFLEAAVNLARVYGDDRSPLAWLYAVASRRLIDQARRRARAPRQVPLDETLAALPDKGEYNRATARALGNAIGVLPEAQRRLVARRLIEGRGVSLNGETVSLDQTFKETDFSGGLALLKKGKRDPLLLVLK